MVSNAVIPRPVKFFDYYFFSEIYWKHEVITPEVRKITHRCHLMLMREWYAGRVIKKLAGRRLRCCPVTYQPSGSGLLLYYMSFV